MISRRALLATAGGVILAGGAYGAGSYRAAMSEIEARISLRSSVISSSAGDLEYAVAGHGPPLMMIHGTGGGFDQGLLFAHRLRDSGFQIVAPSRFGYLRSAFPDDASPAHQADVLVELLDHLEIDRISVSGGSAGALTAAEFALRHPDRCSHLILIVPAANLTNRDPVEFTALQRAAVETVLNSDFWFWTLSSLTPNQMIRTLLATDPAILSKVDAEERRRAALVLNGLMPIRRKIDGLRADGFRAGAPSPTAYERISVPTLILSCEDDLFGTAETARLLADRIPDARLILYPEGGHIWLGHDAELARAVAAFISKTTSPLRASINRNG